MTSDPLRFAMIGASSIGGEALLEPALRRDDVRVVRVAARRPGAAAAYAQRWNLPRSSDRYENALTDPEVDAVYIANAAADHALWTEAAIAAGKHVLCEKPIAVTGNEARTVTEAASDSHRLVMEGFHYRFHPLFTAVRGLVSSGRFGELVSIHSVVDGSRAFDPSSILHVASLGGGALLHNGVYAIHWSRLLFDAEPVAARASSTLNPSGADSETLSDLYFADGRTAVIECSFDRDAPVTLTLAFESARVIVTGPIGAHHGHSLRIEPTFGSTEVMTVAGGTSFDYQLEAFVRRVGAVATTAGGLDRGDDIVAQADVVDAIRRAAGSGRTESVVR
ncbi:Gfo/Idh/MocA family oxidoreductase [Humibacter soli]